MVKPTPRSAQSAKGRDLAIQQIVSRAVVSTEIVDIMQAAGLQSPDISVLSDEFLAEVQGMEKKKLTIDWAQRDSARARMRVLLKRILRHYGYPPDLQDAAVDTAPAVSRIAGGSAPCCGGKSPMAAMPQSGRQPPAHALDAERRGYATLRAPGRGAPGDASHRRAV